MHSKSKSILCLCIALAHPSLNFICQTETGSGSARAAELANTLPAENEVAPWREEQSIQFAIKSTNHGKGQFLFSFGDSSSCRLFSNGKFLFEAMIFDHNGVRYDLSPFYENKLNVHIIKKTMSEYYLTTLSSSNCRMNIIVKKLLRAHGFWSTQRPAIFQRKFNAEPNLQSDQAILMADHPDSLIFNFDVANGESCPSGGGSVILYPRTLVSEFDSSLKGVIAKGAGSNTVRSYTISSANCRYIINVSMDALSPDGLADPLPARDFDQFEYRPAVKYK